MGLWGKVVGLSVAANRKVMEMEMETKTDTEELITTGVNTHGRLIKFREATSGNSAVPTRIFARRDQRSNVGIW